MTAYCYSRDATPSDITPTYGLDLIAMQPWSQFQFQMSSVRDEPIGPRVYPRQDFLHDPESRPSEHSPLLAPEYIKYIEPAFSEASSGVREDGVLLPKHPYVAAFIAKLPSTTAMQELAMQRLEGSTEVTEVDVFTVNGVLGTALEHTDSESIFVLAALQLLRLRHHPAHFTLWGRVPSRFTARRVQMIMDRTPRPIVSSVTWNGIEDELQRLRNMHKKAFSSIVTCVPQPMKDSKRMADAAPQTCLKRRRGPTKLTRRKGTRHNTSKSPHTDLDYPLILAVEDADETERSAKRARTEAHEAATALLAFSQRATGSSKSAAPEPADTSSRSSTCTLSVVEDAKLSTTPMRRSARLVVLPASSSPNPSPQCLPHNTLDAGHNPDASGAESSSTCVEDERPPRGKPGAKRVVSKAQGADAAPRRSARPKKPRLDPNSALDAIPPYVEKTQRLTASKNEQKVREVKTSAAASSKKRAARSTAAKKIVPASNGAVSMKTKPKSDSISSARA